MSDLKDFWEELWEQRPISTFSEDYNQAFANGVQFMWNEVKEKQGKFFWERGGKEFISVLDDGYLHRMFNRWDDVLIQAIEGASFLVKEGFTKSSRITDAQDFLDCVDCLGEDKVKELIKGVGENGK